jgi:MFS family permease
VTKVGLKVHRTFHAIGHSRNFRLFFFGQIVSVSGTWMQMVAAAWLVLQLTGSGVALGIDTALSFGPILLFGAYGGALADRYDKRTMLIVTQSVFAMFAFVYWALVASGVVELWMVYTLSFLFGCVNAIDNPVRQSFYAEMVDASDLPNAVSLNGAVMTGTRIIGPALAGALIASVGMAWCFLINGFSYLAVIGGLLLMHASELRPNRAPREKGAIRSGFRYIWQTDGLRRPMVLMAVMYLFAFNYSVLMPLFAEDTFGGDAGTLGLLLAMTGVGSLLGALYMASKTDPNERRLAIAAVLVGVTTFIVALSPTLHLAVATVPLMGVASIVFFVTANTTLQLTARPEMRGRVMALYAMIFLGSTPFGAPVAGYVGEHFGARVALVGSAVIALATGAVGLWIVDRRRRAAMPLRDAEPSEPVVAERALSA